MDENVTNVRLGNVKIISNVDFEIITIRVYAISLLIVNNMLRIIVTS